MPEKREHPRKIIQVGVAFQVGDGPRIEAVCCDISLGGMFIETREPAAFNAKILVYLKLSGLSDEVKVQSTVRWTETTGMGVQFGMMGARETYALTKLLAANKS